jgi:hypothetical protein
MLNVVSQLSFEDLNVLLTCLSDVLQTSWTVPPRRSVSLSAQTGIHTWSSVYSTLYLRSVELIIAHHELRSSVLACMCLSGSFHLVAL